jgi:hypothetical protein
LRFSGSEYALWVEEVGKKSGRPSFYGPYIADLENEKLYSVRDLSILIFPLITRVEPSKTRRHITDALTRWTPKLGEPDGTTSLGDSHYPAWRGWRWKSNLDRIYWKSQDRYEKDQGFIRNQIITENTDSSKPTSGPNKDSQNLVSLLLKRARLVVFLLQIFFFLGLNVIGIDRTIPTLTDKTSQYEILWLITITGSDKMAYRSIFEIGKRKEATQGYVIRTLSPPILRPTTIGDQLPPPSSSF